MNGVKAIRMKVQAHFCYMATLSSPHVHKHQKILKMLKPIEIINVIFHGLTEVEKIVSKNMFA